MGLFGGNTDASNAQSQANAYINSSGWVVGSGKASGGTLDSVSALGLPWYAWASLGIIGFAWYRKKKKRG